MSRWWPFRRAPARLPAKSFSAVAARLPWLRHLKPSEHKQLHALTEWFLANKTFEGAQGLVVTGAMRVEIAIQACLLILHLDTDYYAGWHAIILYPGDFRVARETTDEDGVVHEWTEELSGESWEQGPVILSWDAAAGAGSEMNVVLHEFAHKLDMRDGAANGCPPLRPGMSLPDWNRAFTDAYDRFHLALEHDEMLWLDDYAAHNPGEFFAVLSEMYFLRPQALQTDMPAVYRQLRLFYGQDPAGLA